MIHSISIVCLNNEQEKMSQHGISSFNEAFFVLDGANIKRIENIPLNFRSSYIFVSP